MTPSPSARDVTQLASESASASLPLVYVIVLNWNCWPDTLKCLDAVARSEYPHYRALVIDNGSVDASQEAMLAARPEVEFIQAGDNLGYAGGNNMGIRHASARGAAYVLLLNPDVRIEPGTLATLVSVAPEQPSIGALSPIVYNTGDPTPSVWFSGGKIDWHQCLVSHRHDLDHSSSFYPSPWATGCCLLLSIQGLEDIGYFDPDFFLYFEETDLCQRLMRAGYRVGVSADARAFHRGFGAAGPKSPKVAYYFTRSLIRFFARHGPAHGTPSALVLWRTARRYLLSRVPMWAVVRGDPLARARARALIDHVLGRRGRVEYY
jgi:GT2 family glycosyltransferase